MHKFGVLSYVTAMALFASSNGFAMPLTSQSSTSTDGSFQTIQLTCDEFGRCWSSSSRYGYGSRLGPPSKWERKGFCPPGHAKKGDC